MITTVPTGSTLAPFATIARCARPVEEYLRRRAERAGARGRPRVGLAAVDLFLLHQFAALLPSPPDVIDLAADATGGASVALWLARPGVREVWAPRRATEMDWRESFPELATSPSAGGRNEDGDGNGASATDRVPVHLDGPMFVPPGDWAELRKQVTAAEQVLVLVAGADGAEAAGLLKGAVAAFPRAVVAVAGLGRVGEPGALAALLDFGRDHPGYRLRALRELSPFLARSDLALVYPADHGSAETALERIAAALEGNFEFINLLNAVVDSALREAEPARAGDNGNGRAGRVAAARPAEQDYPRLVERVRQAVSEAVPQGSSVLVVSKGDDELLKIGGRRAAHFPQAAGGTYAGHHPADDAAAVEHLEALRSKGAQYLVVPATSVWWLEHYEGFRRHLETTAAVAVCRPDTCIVFALAGQCGTARQAPVRWRQKVAKSLNQWARRLRGDRGSDGVAGGGEAK